MDCVCTYPETVGGACREFSIGEMRLTELQLKNVKQGQDFSVQSKFHGRRPNLHFDPKKTVTYGLPNGSLAFHRSDLLGMRM